MNTDDDLIARRAHVLGPAYRLLYSHPVHFVRAEGVHLYDPDGVEYLDAYNNVPCIGHSHPAVTEAVTRQIGLINTNTRYLQDGVVDYAETLVSTLPDELGNVMFTCTGSEANDLALRVARYVTGHTGVIITENAYHGTTQAISEISPSLGPGVPTPNYVYTIPAPDAYEMGADADEVARRMAHHVATGIATLRERGYGVAALVLDTAFSSDGILPSPTTWIAPACEAVRNAGGLFIADEVQAGFARLGEGLWGFARHQVVPDIVTMGKSMGNGYPVAAAVFRPELLEEFGPAVRYFNTFGGSSVAVAAASAVLHTILSEGLISHAARVGNYLHAGLEEIAADDERIALVRGGGLIQGVVFAKETEARHTAGKVVDALREKHILISASGKRATVLKVRPPLVFSEQNADQFLDAFAAVLTDVEDEHGISGS